MEDKKEKRGIVIAWFLKHSCEEFPIYDRDADELLRNLEQAKDKKGEKEMIEENGHKWRDGGVYDRCLRCQIKYGYYLDIKRALEEQPERTYLKELIKCK